MVFHWSLSVNKSPQVSRILLSILVDLNNAVVWMVSTLSLISKSFGDCTKSTNYNWYRHHFHIPLFFNSLLRSRYLSFCSLCFNFTLWSTGRAKSTIQQVLFFFFFFFLLVNIKSGRLADIWWFVCISKYQKSLCVSFSGKDSGFYVYHLFEWSSFTFLHISQWITFATHLCLVLYSFCANLLHSLIMWLIVSSLSPHNLHLLFCCV